MEDKFPQRLRRLRERQGREKAVAAPLLADITERAALEDETWPKSIG